ncbi:MAG: hypothetical protein ACUVXB_05910 [Bryobacteraceae bacterium]
MVEKLPFEARHLDYGVEGMTRREVAPNLYASLGTGRRLQRAGGSLRRSWHHREGRQVEMVRPQAKEPAAVDRSGVFPVARKETHSAVKNVV